MTITIKVARTFAFAFLGIFLPTLASIALDASNTVDWTVARAALVAAVFAGFSAGIRAIVAFFPVFADDNVGLKRTP